MKNRITEIKWAFIFVAMTLLWVALERLIGLHDTLISEHAIYTNIYAIPAIAVYVFALREKRSKDLQGHMSYLEGFVSGVIITFVATVLAPVTQLIASYIITPGYFSNAIAFAVDSGNMTLEAAEAYFSFVNYLIQTLIGTPVMGLITSAIVAFFIKNK